MWLYPYFKLLSEQGQGHFASGSRWDLRLSCLHLSMDFDTFDCELYLWVFCNLKCKSLLFLNMPGLLTNQLSGILLSLLPISVKKYWITMCKYHEIYMSPGYEFRFPCLYTECNTPGTIIHVYMRIFWHSLYYTM